MCSFSWVFLQRGCLKAMLCRLGQCKGMGELERGRQSCARGSSDVGWSPGTDLLHVNPSLTADFVVIV